MSNGMSKQKFLRILAFVIILIVVSSNMSIWFMTIKEARNAPTYEDVLIVQIGNSPEVVCASELLVKNLDNYEGGIHRKHTTTSNLDNTNFIALESLSITSSITHMDLIRDIRVKKIVANINDLNSVLIRNYAGVLIIVGHGTPNGLVEGTDSLAWSLLAAEIKRTEPKIPAILSCFSSEIQKYLPSAVGFSGEIDASLGAIALSALVVSAFNGKSSDTTQYTQQFINRMIVLEQNPDRYRPLANWGAVRKVVTQIIRATPAPKTYWNNKAVALKILGMVIGTILLILLDHLSSSKAKMLGLIAGTIAVVSSLVGIIGQVTGLDQQFKVSVWWGTLNLWPIVKTGVGLLVCGCILAFGTPMIALMNLVVRNGAGIILYSLISYFASTASYQSIFTQIGRVLGNFLASLLLPIIVTLFGMAGIFLNVFAQKIVKTLIYLLCVVVIFSAIDNLKSRALSLFDVSKAISNSLERSLTLWNICCWIVDWSMLFA